MHKLTYIQPEKKTTDKKRKFLGMTTTHCANFKKSVWIIPLLKCGGLSAILMGSISLHAYDLYFMDEPTTGRLSMTVLFSCLNKSPQTGKGSSNQRPSELKACTNRDTQIGKLEQTSDFSELKNSLPMVFWLEDIYFIYIAISAQINSVCKSHNIWYIYIYLHCISI